jgi:hypothetical protein
MFILNTLIGYNNFQLLFIFLAITPSCALLPKCINISQDIPVKITYSTVFNSPVLNGITSFEDKLYNIVLLLKYD